MNRNKALRLLCDGFKQEFAMKVFEGEAFADMLHQESFDFVQANIPLVDEDDKFELASMLEESIKLGNY